MIKDTERFKIKPCPRCKAENGLQPHWFSDYAPGARCWIECTNCDYRSGRADNMKEAEEIWNKEK